MMGIYDETKKFEDKTKGRIVINIDRTKKEQTAIEMTAENVSVKELLHSMKNIIDAIHQQTGRERATIMSELVLIVMEADSRGE